MKNTKQFQGKRVLVLGLAKSGYAVSRLLHRLGASVIVNDAKPFEENVVARELEESGMTIVCGSHPLSLLDQPIDFIVKNPGIPYSNPMIKRAIEQDIPVITEVEVASILSEADIIAITGSNGKTTTTTLIVEMLKGSGKEPLVAGNIGTVSCEVAEMATKNHIIVMEVSSFQLMGTKQFHPKVAVLLNLFDAHLDYHGSKKAYVKAKGKIFNNLGNEDYLIANQDQDEVVELTSSKQGVRVPFSVSQSLAHGAHIQAGVLYFRGEEIMETKDIVLPGTHNLENSLAAVAAAKLMGAQTKRIVEVLTTFTGVKHRLQYVKTVKGRKFYNDSKATNILATETAISAFDNEALILLIGGLDRGNGFEDLISSFKHVKAVVTFGETKHKVQTAAKQAGVPIIKEAANAEAAVPIAFTFSDEDDIILLSPACASWDQYQTFEERGEKFITAVNNLDS